LLEQGLLRDIGHKGEVLNVTDKGYEAVDSLRGTEGAVNKPTK